MRADLIPAVLCVTLALTPAAARAAIFKHVDEQGRVTYRDSPPIAAGSTTQLRIPAPPGPEDVERARRIAAQEKQELMRLVAARRMPVPVVVLPYREPWPPISHSGYAARPSSIYWVTAVGVPARAVMRQSRSRGR